MTFRHLLVPMDFSDTSRHALDYARAFAGPLHARLTLLHVAPDAYTQSWIVEGARLAVPNILDTWRRDAQREIDRIRAEVPTATAVVAAGEPFVEIVRYAKREQVDLIVIGTHGRGPVGHLLLGSVAEKVVRHAPCPVLTVRRPAPPLMPPLTREVPA